MTPPAPGGLLVLGDVVTDVVARHRTPLVTGTDTAAEIRLEPGGAGANVACWAARWGCADVRLAGRVGADAAVWHREELAASGVRACLTVDAQAPTGTVICLVDGAAGAERSFLTDSGAVLRLGPDDISPALLDGVAHLHLSGYLFFGTPSREAALEALRMARARGIPVSVDPASAGFLKETGVDRFLEATEGVDVLLPSHDEALLLAGRGGRSELTASAQELSARFPLVVVKRGARGTLVCSAGAVLGEAAARPAEAVDTTGAGDAFTGAFLAARLAGADPLTAAEEGCRAGALAVGRVGGRPPRD
ncbi:carbohydrate kinase family protein [Streptomyces sp. NPDC050418]|uniref:carbohydrate kinase family protein n=1 Tax=Streptomyces sp. NPDC050418 TaxID=3365612 RepID=UPI00378A3857